MIVFMVAEKPSLAQSISKILSNNQATSYRGFNNACSVYEWTGKFMNYGCKFRMTSVCGHVMSLDFSGQYNNWDKVDPVRHEQSMTLDDYQIAVLDKSTTSIFILLLANRPNCSMQRP
jgi:DNA topoisomerase IA